MDIELLTSTVLQVTRLFAELDLGMGRSVNIMIVNGIGLVILILGPATAIIIIQGFDKTVTAVTRRGAQKGMSGAGGIVNKATAKPRAAFTGMVKRKATETGLGMADRTKSGFRPKNLAAAALARQAFITQRQRTIMGQKGEAYEAEQIKNAKDEIEFLGIKGKKGNLKQYIDDHPGKGNQFARIAAMQELAEAGGDKELAEYFASSDLGMKMDAAKVISSSGKMKDAAAPLFFEAAGYAGERKMAESGVADARDANGRKTGAKAGPVSAQEAHRLASYAGRDLREAKANEQISQSYVLNLKPGQILGGAPGVTGLRDSLIDPSVDHNDPGQMAAARENATKKLADIIHNIESNPRLQEKINDEQRKAFQQVRNEATAYGWQAPPPPP